MPTPGPGTCRVLLQCAAATLVAHALVAVVYGLVWPDVATLVPAIDHAPRFQQDFVAYYHAAAANVLREPSPPPGYYYPAFFALLLAPLGALAPTTAALAWLGVQAAAWLCYVLVVARGLCCARVGGTFVVALVAATSFPMLHNLVWGQVSVLLALACWGAAAAALRGRSTLAGVVLGVAAAIKYYPAWFVVWLALRREWRACGAFVAAAIVCAVVLPAATLGVDGWLAYDAEIARRAADAGWIVDDPNSQYVANVARRWWFLVSGERVGDGAMTALRWLGVAAAIAIAWLAHRRQRAGQPVFAFAALTTALPFVVTTSWPHYFAALVGAQATLWLAAAGTRRPRAVRAALAVSVTLASVGAFAFAPTWAHYNGYGLLFVANAAVLVGVALAAPKQPS
jgi:alpha-1,2-mannosyltransferase